MQIAHSHLVILKGDVTWKEIYDALEKAGIDLEIEWDSASNYSCLKGMLFSRMPKDL
jgi:sugar phosphate isomerase/epimerase